MVVFSVNVGRVSMNNIKHGVLLELLIVIYASLVSIASSSLLIFAMAKWQGVVRHSTYDLENTIYGGKATMNENMHSLWLLL